MGPIIEQGACRCWRNGRDDDSYYDLAAGQWVTLEQEAFPMPTLPCTCALESENLHTQRCRYLQHALAFSFAGLCCGPAVGYRKKTGILLPHVYLSESCKKSHSTPRMDQLKETSLLWPVDSLFTFMCLLTLMKSAAMS
ncbi:uncharacterized protein AAEQ78_017029 isoform 1-T2 [Lycaon pictus]